MRLSILIDSEKNAELLKTWLQHVDFVQSVDESSVSWALAGTPASDEEIRQMLDDCMASDEGMVSDNFFETLK